MPSSIDSLSVDEFNARRSAMFLDFDGTLVDFATRPEMVELPAGTLAAVFSLYDVLDGAIAIISGREITDIDAYF